MAVMDVILKAVDKVSPVMDKMAKRSNTSIGTMQKQFKAAEGSLLAVGAAMTVVGGLVVAASFKLVKMASDAEETSSKFRTVFQDVIGEADAMAKNLSRNYGLSSTAAKQLMGDTGDLLTGFGFTGEAALDLAGEVNKLAVDLASFTNFSGGAEGASQALTKALLGERESVKSLGISILEEDVKAKVALITKQGMIFETERQAKAYATLLIAQEQSKNAIGDYQRTQEGFANQSRELRARLTDLAIVFADKLLPAATAMITKTREIVEKITDWAEKHPVLTGILVKFGAALGVLVGTGGLLILGAIAVTKMGGAIKESIQFFKTFIQVLPLITAKVWAFTASLLANPITWWVIGITAAIAAIVLLWKNWEKISEWISAKIDWICDKFNWLGEKIKWVAEKLGIYKEKTEEVTEASQELKIATEEAGEAIGDLAVSEGEAKEEAEALKEENIELADSLETVGEKAGIASDSIKLYGEDIAENYIQLAGRAGDSWEEFYAFWEAEAERTAKEIIKLNKEVEESTPKPKPSNLYKIVDAEGNTLGLQSGNILSQAQKDEGVTLVKIHEGGQVRTTIPGGEGIALLKDREIVSTPGDQGWIPKQININILEGAVQMTSQRLDEGTIKNAGKWLFEEIYEQFRANNIKLVWG